MNATLLPIVDAFADQRVLVLGDAMLDGYLEGSIHRFCPEAPAPIVDLVDQIETPGGAANTALNARKLGAQVTFLSAVGTDAAGATLERMLAAEDIVTRPLLRIPERQTLVKRRVVAGSQIVLRIDEGSTQVLSARDESRLLQLLETLYPQMDAVIVSDYHYGVMTPRVIRRLADLQTRWSRVLVVDSRRLALYQDVGVTAVKPNYAGGGRLARWPCARAVSRADRRDRGLWSSAPRFDRCPDCGRHARSRRGLDS